MNIAVLFPVMAFVAGGMTAYQPLINAKLGQNLNSPIWASFISFAVGTVFLLALGLIVSGKFMVVETQGLRWWMFTGGLLGAFFVTVTIYVVPYLGVAAMVALLIAGQLIMAAVLDHYGVLSESSNTITVQKLAGMILLALGAFITLKN